MIKFCFENTSEYANLISSVDKNTSGFSRFTISPFFNRMNVFCSRNLKYWDAIKSYDLNDKPDKYIIPVGVNNDPMNWAGGGYWDVNNKVESIFSYLNPTYLEDLRKGVAFLMIDSSLEGYHDDLIFNFFHNECRMYNISPTRIIFVTGNSMVEERYRIWLLFNPFLEKINVVPYTHFDSDVFIEAQEMGNKIPNYENQLNYKNKNLNEIKLYSFLNKKTREHRIWFYTLLVNQNMIDDGLISMNFFNSHIRTLGSTKMFKNFSDVSSNTTPKVLYNTPNEIFDPSFYVRRIHHKVTLDTWFSIISEARFEDEEGTIFLSEKIFKPIACHHPFVVLGNKNSLSELKKMGYMTFENFIDESYDNDSNLKRMESLIKSINGVKKIENKLSWFADMEKVLKHNYEVLRYNATEIYPSAFIKVQGIFYNN